LIGAETSEEMFARAADAALADGEPLQHNAYKLPLARNLVAQAMRELLARTR